MCKLNNTFKQPIRNQSKIRKYLKTNQNETKIYHISQLMGFSKITNKKVFLVYSGPYHKNTINFVAYKQLKLISHSLGDWEVQDKDSSRFTVW
jgi:hypothetical protein